MSVTLDQGQCHQAEGQTLRINPKLASDQLYTYIPLPPVLEVIYNAADLCLVHSDNKH